MKGLIELPYDIEKHVQYWTTSAQEDLETAEFLVGSGRSRHGLFFAHLALEKTLKAHVCKHTEEIAPRMHNLLRLTEMSNCDLSESHKEFLARFDRYQLEGRYPEFWPARIDREKAYRELHQAKELLQWLMNRL